MLALACKPKAGPPAPAPTSPPVAVDGPLQDSGIHDAAADGKLEAVKQILRKDARQVNARDSVGATPLHWAAAEGHPEVVTLLLASGADVNAQATNGVTPLKSAAHRGQVDTATLLLAHGADVDLTDKEGQTSLHNAAFRGHLAVVRLLVAHKANVNARDLRKSTPLHSAAAGGNLGVVDLLLGSRADVNAVDQSGLTPLQVAERERQVDVAALLRQRAAGGAAPLRTRELTEKDRQTLLVHLPGAEKVAPVADEVLEAAAAMSRAADGMSKTSRPSPDRALIALGAALVKTVDACHRLVPLIQERSTPPLGSLLNPTPAERRQWQAYFRNQQAYWDALDKIARGGTRLTTLDPIGSAGPPADAGPLVRDGGRELVATGESFGLAPNLFVLGHAIDDLRRAMLRQDWNACAQTAKLTAQLTDLLGTNLAFIRGILCQSGAAKLVALALSTLGASNPPATRDLEGALELFRRSLVEQAHCGRRQHDTARDLVTPAGDPELARLVGQVQGSAPVLLVRLNRYDSPIARVAEAREALRDTHKGTTSAMKAAGALLRTSGEWPTLVATGEALERAAESLDSGSGAAATRVLEDAGRNLVMAERTMVLERLLTELFEKK